MQFEQVSEGCEGCGQYSKGVGRGSRHGERGEMEVEEVSAEEKEGRGDQQWGNDRYSLSLAGGARRVEVAGKGK